jgi:Pyruvate/2-oxoacid:ferredoxin oxidoreductase gamma subunit
MNIDSLLRKLGIPKTVSIDAILGGLNLTESVDADILIRKIVSKTLNVNTVLKKSNLTSSFNVDAVNTSGMPLVQFAINSLFTKMELKICADIDVSFVGKNSRQISINALLLKRRTNTISIGTFFRALNIPKAVSVDNLLRKGYSKTFNADFSARQSTSRTISTNALLKKLGLTRSMNINVFLRKLGLLKYVDTDVYTTAKEALQFAIDSILTKADHLKTLGIDVIAIKSAIHACLDVDLNIGSEVRNRNINVDALLLLNNLLQTANVDVQLYKSYLKVFSTDSFIRKILTTALMLDTLIQYKNLLTALSVDMMLTSKDLPVKYFSIDALIRSLETIVTEADVLVRKTISSSFSADTTLRGDYWLKNVDVDMRLLKRLTTMANVDCFTQQSHTISFNTDLTLIKQSTLALLVDTLLKKTGCTSGFGVDASCGKYTPVATRLVLTAAWFEPLSITVAVFEPLSVTALETNSLTIECEEL